MSELQVPQPGEFLLYETEDGRTRVECRFAEETIWLSQAMMAELFQTSSQNITVHLKALYSEGEINPEATCKRYLQVRSEGARNVQRNVKFYNLDAILAVGYRVRSARGTQFRRWATERLREYLVKGFTLDDERLKNPPVAGSGVPDRFDELLERIRDIRASERRMYLRVREIFAMAADYSPTMPQTTKFFRFIQNKLHFAVTGKTAAELIVERTDSRRPNMGLATWKSGSVQKADVTVAKTFLHARFALGDDVLKPYKIVIDRWLWPDAFKQNTSVIKAKKAISDYRKAIGQPEGLAELMVFFCECAAGFGSAVALQDEGYFDALVRMFENALKAIAALAEDRRPELMARMHALRPLGHRIGYGVGDAMDHLLVA